MKKYSIHIINLIFLLSCSPKNQELEKALKLAGDNRLELEKVLQHYSQHPADTLKFRAARFLIENMPGHYTLEGEVINEYRDKIYADSSATYFAKKTLEICMTHMKNIQDISCKDEDIQHIKADFLIRHIDRSFEKLNSYSWLQDIPFYLFLEHVLPYRLGHERLDLWIDSLHISPENSEEINGVNTKYTVEGIWNTPILENANTKISYDFLIELFGKNIYQDCIFITIRDNFQSRAAAFPQSIDCIPVYANRNGFHYWNSIRTPESKMPNVNGTIERKASKIYRKTYSRQLVLTPKKDEYIPEFFQDPFYKDVSNEYMHTADAKINLYSSPKDITNYAYLCVFNNLKWQPAAIGNLSSSGADFSNMGKNLIYLPVYYRNKKMNSLNYPFILNLKGKIQYLIPDTNSRQTIRLTRKYPLNSTLYSFYKRLEETIIEISHSPDFNTPDTLQFTPDRSYTHIKYNTDSSKSYRYCRIKIFGGIEIAELFFIDAHNNPIAVQVDSTLIAGFDGDPLTNIKWFNAKKMIIDFNHPIHLSKIIALPRSDGNGIYPGDEYELFYHDLEGWQSLGRQIATDYHLDYTNVPKGALYWLHNRTKGVEERIFTVTDKGEIRFW